MNVRRIDLAAIAGFVLASAAGYWLWTGQGPAIWLNSFMVLCGAA